MKRVISLLVVLLLSLSLAACASESNTENQPGDSSKEQTSEKPVETKAEPVNLVFGTGGTSGAYYPIGGALKTIFEESELINNVTVEATGASVKNFQNIRDGINQLAIVMSDVANDATMGTGAFEGSKIDSQAIAGLYPNVVQIVVTKESGIKTIDDFKNKRIGVGQVGSGVEISAKIVLEAAGLSYEDLAQVTHTGYADSVQAMKDGNLDGAFFTSGVPNANITDLKQTSDIVFIPIEGDVAINLKEKHLYYLDYTIPAGDKAKYNLDQDLNIVAIKNMIVVSPSLSEDVVYEMTKRLYDYLGTDSVSVGALKEFNRDDMGNDLVLTLHPGAKKFYEENGLLK